MKAIKLITTLFSLLFLLLLSSCMPDSMSKWEESPTIKDDAPITTLAPPENYGYGDFLGGQTSIVFDLGTTIAPISKNTEFIGTGVSFSVSPSLPSGLVLDPLTGTISGTPTAISANKEYVFVASNSGGTDDTLLKIEVRAPEVLTSLTYIDEATKEDVTTAVNYRQVNKGMRFDPVSSSQVTTWEIDTILTPASPNVQASEIPGDFPEACLGMIKVVRGLCFDTQNGSIFGSPKDVITSPIKITVTAKKTISGVVSQIQSSFEIAFFTLPQNLIYSQSMTLEIATNDISGIAVNSIIKVADATANTCTYGQVIGVVGSKKTLLIKKYSSDVIVTNRFKLVGVSASLVNAANPCLPSSNADMTGLPALPLRNTTIYQVANVFEAQKEFSFKVLSVEGEELEYEISPALTASNFVSSSFDEETGEFRASLKSSFSATTFTVTASNNVGSTTATIYLSPVNLPPLQLNYSTQVLLKVRDASNFNVGDLISSPISGLNESGATGRVIGKIVDTTSTLAQALIVDVEEGKFIAEDSLDTHIPYNVEKTTVGGYWRLEVEDSSVFTVGDYLSNENMAFGKVRSINGASVYVTTLSGFFSQEDKLDNAYPYVGEETEVVEAFEDTMIVAHTATITALATGATTPAAATITSTALKEGEAILTDRGSVTMVESQPVAKLSHSNISTFRLFDSFEQGAVKGSIYAIVEGAGTAGTLYINQITGGHYTVGGGITVVNYGHRFAFRGTKGNLSVGDTLKANLTLDLIESRHYLTTVTETAFSPVKVRTGATVATVNASNRTGNSVGRIANLDTYLNTVHISMDRNVLAPNLYFDTKNPIDYSPARIGMYPQISTVSTTNTIILRRGIPISFQRNLATEVKATYSIYPPLPVGLILDTSSGEISGTPSKASALKSYTVTATNSISNTKFTFNLKVEDFFEIELENPDASYILHRIGKNSNARACRVYQDQLNTGEKEEVNMTCYLEAGELDLFLLGLKFNTIAGPGMCNHVSIRPYSYYAKPYRGDSDSSVHKYYRVNYSDGCTLVADTDLDGRTDYLIDPVDETAPQCDLAPVGVGPEDRDDGDGDGDCADESAATAITSFTSLTDFNKSMASASGIENSQYLCISNYDEDFMCDEGEIELTTITATRISDSDSRCRYPTATVGKVECGGRRSACVAGALRGSVISDEMIDDGFTALVVASNINDTTKLPYETIRPNERRLGSNKFLANYSIDHGFFAISNREEDYTFDVDSYISFFSSGFLGHGDPMSNMNPVYQFSCLDQSDNAKARINIMVRDWDSAFNVNSPIDQNHQRKLLPQTVSTQAGSTITLSADFEPRHIAIGSLIRLGDNNYGRQFYQVVATPATNQITLSPTPYLNYQTAAGISKQIYYTPFKGLDEMSRIIETMDAGFMVNPVFNAFFNSYRDFDDTLTYSSANSPNLTYLNRHDYIQSALISGQLNDGDTVQFVTFSSSGVMQAAEAPVQTFTIPLSGVNGNTINLGAITPRAYFQNLHYLRKVTGTPREDIFFAIEYVAHGANTVVVYPLTRPFPGDLLK